MRIKHRHGTVRTYEGKKGVSVNYYYMNPETGLRQSKTFPPGCSKDRIENEIARIEAEIDAYKFGIVDEFSYTKKRIDNVTIGELIQRFNTDRFRLDNLNAKTIARAANSLRLMEDIIGTEARAKDFADESPHEYLSRFRSILLQERRDRCIETGKEVNEDSLKRGVNNELKAIKAFFRYCAKQKWIRKDHVPTIERFSVIKKKRPDCLDISEIVKVENELTGILKLAWQIFRYTGARRCEVVKDFKTGDGLKWKDINWLRREISFTSKGKAETIPLNTTLIRCLKRRQNELGEKYNPEGHVIPFSGDYVSRRFREAMRRLEIHKSGYSCHIVRHSVATILSSHNIELARLILRHEDIQTTQIYTHLERMMREAIEML